MFIYPITIILILLNVLPEKLASAKVFKAVVVTTMVFSVPDFLATIGLEETVSNVQNYIPLSAYSLGWVLPATAVFVLINLSNNLKSTS